MCADRSPLQKVHAKVAAEAKKVAEQAKAKIDETKAKIAQRSKLLADKVKARLSESASTGSDTCSPQAAAMKAKAEGTEIAKKTADKLKTQWKSVKVRALCTWFT